ncbi:GNAT family N-acetyltransferase [Nitratireductor pacificus]|uniref:BioF2-like acetyltransferase domain-containing protein n=1 Tax=Nitratireductor pacificus pht-3B TaxID=391937 RepID=K2MHM1_9HYPH|nr:GNAT family N-acetyltransferase [Nitratireductor pacificus]EKF20240.1 hypothetical protein NA2_03262 [Nitratireductor pacificus pht-3B]
MNSASSHAEIQDPAAHAGGAPTLTVSSADPTARAQYREDCRTAHFMPAQSPDWIDAWAEHASNACIIVRLSDGERHLLSLALEIAAHGPLRIARFIGDRHANGNFPATERSLGGPLPPQLMTALLEGLRRQRPDIDLLALERQVHAIDGAQNPLLAWPGTPSPNVALAVDLAGGFEAVLGRASGKRKRKQHRAQARKLEAAGGHRRLRATSRAETDAMLDAFFAMKRHRFAKMGIRDVFAAESVQQAFRTLFGDAVRAEEPAFVMHGLEVGGRLRAVTGSSRTATRMICEFSSITEDELSDISPGAFLFFENIEEACGDGLQVYDFSVGDEYYKRLWCDLETVQFDTFVPLTARGRLLALSRSGLAHAKRRINGNPRLWSAAKWLRRKLAFLRG